MIVFSCSGGHLGESSGHSFGAGGLSGQPTLVNRENFVFRNDDRPFNNVL